MGIFTLEQMRNGQLGALDLEKDLNIMLEFNFLIVITTYHKNVPLAFTWFMRSYFFMGVSNVPVL
jgi:hypothetical protein